MEPTVTTAGWASRGFHFLLPVASENTPAYFVLNGRPMCLTSFTTKPDYNCHDCLESPNRKSVTDVKLHGRKKYVYYKFDNQRPRLICKSSTDNTGTMLDAI
jgi:hypothetical protein